MAAANQLQPVYLAAVQQRIPDSQVASTANASPGSIEASWRTVGENANSYRLLDERSIRETEAGTSYAIAYRFKSGPFKGFERTAVADCSGKRRFEVTNQSEWTTRPFSDVTEGTLNSQELEIACDLLAKKKSEGRGPIAATESSASGASDWRHAAANEYSMRYVDANSIRSVDGALVYRLSYRYANVNVKGFERTVVADCNGKRRFEVMDESKMGTKPFKDASAGINRDELDFACLLASRSPATARKGVSTAAIAADGSANIPQWLSIGSDVYANRFLDTNSIQPNEGAITYRIKYVNKDSRHPGYERSVVSDCSTKQRFEITQQEEWTSRPFRSVYAGTAQADEVAIACQLALKK